MIKCLVNYDQTTDNLSIRFLCIIKSSFCDGKFIPEMFIINLLFNEDKDGAKEIPSKLSCQNLV